MQNIMITRTNAPKAKPADESKLGFGRIFTDHMLLMDFNRTSGWHNLRVEPYHAFEMDPAALVLHYGQTIFEGLKCYRREDGGLQLFRPEDNFRRMNRSAERISIPPFQVEDAMNGLKALIEIDADWVPRLPGTTLYLRPTLIATDPYVGVRAGDEYVFYIIMSPVGAYYANGLQPVGIYVEDDYVRAVRGGIGNAKTAANYAASLKAGEEAKKKGYDQVLWLDGVERKYVEEVGSMNIMFVIDGKLVTPELNGSILPGITRDSVLKIAKDQGMQVEERKISIDELFSAAESGRLTDAFGTGTAAVVSPIRELAYSGRSITINGGEIGNVAKHMYDTLSGIQFGQLPDPFGWMVRL